MWSSNNTFVCTVRSFISTLCCVASIYIPSPGLTRPNLLGSPFQWFISQLAPDTKCNVLYTEAGPLHLSCDFYMAIVISWSAYLLKLHKCMKTAFFLLYPTAMLLPYPVIKRVISSIASFCALGSGGQDMQECVCQILFYCRELL